MNRRYSSVNGATGGPAPSNQSTSGRYSLAGRPSAVGPSRLSRTNDKQVASDLAAMNISASQQSQASQRHSLAPRQSLDRNSISRYLFIL